MAAAAYRSGEELTDERTGDRHDYSRRSGVDHAEIIAPAQAPDWVRDRAQLSGTRPRRPSGAGTRR